MMYDSNPNEWDARMYLQVPTSTYKYYKCRPFGGQKGVHLRSGFAILVLQFQFMRTRTQIWNRPCLGKMLAATLPLQ